MNTQATFIEGDIGAILRSLREHTVLDVAELRGAIEKHFGDAILADESIAIAINHKLIEDKGNWLALTDAGEKWLDSQGAGLHVERENSSSDGVPSKPYEVSKLKMEEKKISLFQALRKIEKKEINLSPDFQRAFVWDEIRQSRLIESVLIRIPLPAFYLDATDQVKWNVVDGLQRLTTLYRYCRGQSFPLVGLQFLEQLEGKRFEELPPNFKVLIEDDTQLLFYNLMPGTPLEAKFTIFSRVNTGGMQLTAQEIRHALSQGKVTSLLARLAKSDQFIRATGGVVESLRMSDRELVLRALAFILLGTGAYKQFNELDAFLLTAMNTINGLTDGELRDLETSFLESLEKVVAIFGKYAFRKFTETSGRRGPLNKALFETWTTSVKNYSIEQLGSHRSKIISHFVNMINLDPAFVRSISSSTGSASAVAARFSAIESLLRVAIR